IYFSFAGHGGNRAESEAIYDAIWRDGLDATTRVGGTISHHHGVGLLKADQMAGEHREAMAIFAGLKSSLDPDGIMNPGKMGLAQAQAGITGLALEKILVPRGLTIGDYPPAVLMSTIGGILAVRTPGKSSARHGFFEDAVVGVSAVLADGRTIHTRVAPRRSTGPDLARALCGSEGTVGFITSQVLRIHVRPESGLVAGYHLPVVDATVGARQPPLPQGA